MTLKIEEPITAKVEATSVNNSIDKPRKRKWLRKSIKILGIAGISVFFLYFLAGVIWRFSGSNQWELAYEKNGVKVYTLKMPGSDILQVKGVMRYRSTLAGAVKINSTNNTLVEVGAKGIADLGGDDQAKYSTFRFNLGFPFQPREYVTRTQIYQNPITKTVLIETWAVPDKMPPNPCCFRVNELHNSQRITPLGNGELEWEYVMNQNIGGFVPAYLQNYGRVKTMSRWMPLIQRWLLEPKFNYQAAKFSWIQE
jgi:hypothetical protein